MIDDEDIDNMEDELQAVMATLGITGSIENLQASLANNPDLQELLQNALSNNQNPNAQTLAQQIGILKGFEENRQYACPIDDCLKVFND